jgi:1,4-alpha-glucan branching enzyme
MTSLKNRDPVKRALADDPLLAPYEAHLRRRAARVAQTEKRLTGGRTSLCDFAGGHEYFGLHFRDGRWVFREWAPGATAIFLIGEFNGWRKRPDFALQKISADGIWEIRLPAGLLSHGQLYRLVMCWPGGEGDRLPAWGRRMVQDPETLIFNAQVWRPETPYHWRYPEYRNPSQPRLIYEAHVGMAQQEERIGTYREFTDTVIPRIATAGYNTIQLMAIQEHPYYASFGYQVSNFFAPSSRFGTPDDLKELIDAAHAVGLAVVMDLVHSHAVRNEVEGLSRFDGTTFQFFHEGPRGEHVAWDSRCFDYGKPQVLHFLLSNCRYWLDEFHLDGFRFDGVTSMLYLHHGLGRPFTGYDDYFGDDVDEDALVYLGLANRLIHELRPDAVIIAEDVSGMPGLAASASHAGAGFDHRFAMGVPDYWIKLLKEVPDEHWPLGHLWFELNNRRRGEKTISYAESHDQALVGDQTLIFRMIGAAMYDRMDVDSQDPRVDRGMALHKMIRFITLLTAGSGYLNFMGNEFGHPEWIDFPREGNNWSYRHARRLWQLAEDKHLRYHFLGKFDRDMIALAKSRDVLKTDTVRLIYEHQQNKILAFCRAGLTFVFNFHPGQSYTDYQITAPPGKYRLLLDSDAPQYGGHGRLRANQAYFTLSGGQPRRNHLSLYLPSRTALVLQPENRHGAPISESSID